jgi:hypothetical protein
MIRVLPNYQGTWSGSYTITGCTHTGDLARANFCSNFPNNRVFPTNLNLTQEQDRVQGRFFFGSLGGDASGPVQTDGRVLLTGAVLDPAATIEVAWSISSTAPGRISGGLSQIWRGTGLSGDARINADIRDLNRSSVVAAASHAPRMQRGSFRISSGISTVDRHRGPEQSEPVNLLNLLNLLNLVNFFTIRTTTPSTSCSWRAAVVGP